MIERFESPVSSTAASGLYAHHGQCEAAGEWFRDIRPNVFSGTFFAYFLCASKESRSPCPGEFRARSHEVRKSHAQRANKALAQRVGPGTNPAQSATLVILPLAAHSGGDSQSQKGPRMTITMTSVRQLCVAAGASLATVAALAQPAVIYDMGGKFDKSFNEAAYNGAERWKKEFGKPYLEFEIANATQREQAKRRMAERGASPIVGVGFSQGSTMEKVAKEFPALKFTIIDYVIAAPNVESVVFKEHEGSFLVGMMAAIASKSGKVGFVGGMDIPLIRKFQCGYEQGARYANPKVEISANMTGTTPTAWNDPARGAELAKAQFAKGVDVVFAAAGGTGVGVYQAAKDAGKLAIGVDSNQNHLQPGTMLTSMVKRVDVAVYNSFKNHKAGMTSLGLKEGGVDYALDQHNARLVTPQMKTKVDAAKADIISGKIKVIDYMAGNACR
jgi:basic membrane protein A and related proteins